MALIAIVLTVLIVADATVGRINHALGLLAVSTDKAEVFLNLQDRIVSSNLLSALASFPVTESTERDLKVLDELRTDYLRALTVAIDHTLEFAGSGRDIQQKWLDIRMAHLQEADAFRSFVASPLSDAARNEYMIRFMRKWGHIETEEKQLFGNLVGVLQVELREALPSIVHDTSDIEQFKSDLAQLDLAARDFAIKTTEALSASAVKAFDHRVFDLSAAADNIRTSTAYHISLRRVNVALARVEPFLLPRITAVAERVSTKAGYDAIQSIINSLTSIQTRGLNEQTLPEVHSICEAFPRLLDRTRTPVTKDDAAAALADLAVIAAVAVKATAQERRVLAHQAEPSSMTLLWAEEQLLTHRIQAARPKTAAALEDARDAVIAARRQLDRDGYSVGRFLEVQRNMRLLVFVVCGAVKEKLTLAGVDEAEMTRLDAIKKTLSF